MMSTVAKHQDLVNQKISVGTVPIGQTPVVPGSVAGNEGMYLDEDDLIDTGKDLTEDDKIMLAMK